MHRTYIVQNNTAGSNGPKYIRVYNKVEKENYCSSCVVHAKKSKKKTMVYLYALEMGKIKENTWMLWVKRNRKTNDDTLRLSHINRYSNFFNENVAFNFCWTALTLKPHKSTCDILTCVGVFIPFDPDAIRACVFVYLLLPSRLLNLPKPTHGLPFNNSNISSLRTVNAPNNTLASHAHIAIRRMIWSK